MGCSYLTSWSTYGAKTARIRFNIIVEVKKIMYHGVFYCGTLLCRDLCTPFSVHHCSKEIHLNLLHLLHPILIYLNFLLAFAIAPAASKPLDRCAFLVLRPFPVLSTGNPPPFRNASANLAPPRLGTTSPLNALQYFSPETEAHWCRGPKEGGARMAAEIGRAHV